jgi:NADH-quinone oxidoreductase subunit G
MATAHPDYSLLSSLAATIAQAVDASIGYLPGAANSVGAHLLGVMPQGNGKNAVGMLEKPCNGYLLLGIEPGYDLGNPAKGRAALNQADFVVALSSYSSDDLEEVADVILPIAGFAETSGTYVNAAGNWQSFNGAAVPQGESRPGWKVLRVLGSMMYLDGFEQDDSSEVLAEARSLVGEQSPDNSFTVELGREQRISTEGLIRIGDVPIYAADPLVRHAPALQQTADAVNAATLRVNAAVAAEAGVTDGESVRVVQDGNETIFPVVIDSAIPDGCVRLPAAVPGTEMLGNQFGSITLEKVQ